MDVGRICILLLSVAICIVGSRRTKQKDEPLVRVHKHKHYASLEKSPLINDDSLRSKLRPRWRRSITTFCQTQACLLLLKKLEQELAKNHQGVYSGRW